MKTRNFGLDEKGFKEMAKKLRSGDEALFKHIFLKQFQNCRNYLISKYRLSSEEAYDICMDTMIHFRMLIIRDKVHYGNLSFLFNKVASQIYFKKGEREKRMVYFDSVQDNIEVSQEFNEELQEILDLGWKKLGEECQKILMLFYWQGLKLFQIAEIMDKKPETTRKQKIRCVHKLRANILEATTGNTKA